MNKLIDSVVKSWPQELTNKKVYTIGLSGGIDSVVLLFIFAQIRELKSIVVRAVHVNHGISSNALLWETFCTSLCAKLKIELRIERFSIQKNGGESLENNARITRYSVFCGLDTDVIVLAHHKNDQVETLLSQMLRGSDLHNIAAMQEVIYKQNTLIWRPLLKITRHEIEEFAKFYGLSNINDESNDNVSYLRNYVRHNLIPQIIQWDKNALNKLFSVTTKLQEALSLIDEVATSDLATTIRADDSLIDLEQFKQLSTLRQTNLLNCFIKNNNLLLPSKKQIHEFCRQATNSAWDSHPELSLYYNAKLVKEKNCIKIIQL